MQPSGSIPTLHPNGFIQYPLTPEGDVRLHIWSPGLPLAQQVHTPIHDHTFDFESWVVLGELNHQTFYLKPGDGFRLWGASDILRPTGSCFDLEEDEHLFLKTTSHYRFPAGKFHQSHGMSTGITATIMHKTHIGHTPFSYVAIPQSVEPDNEFRRDQYPVSALQLHVEGVRRMLLEGKGYLPVNLRDFIEAIPPLVVNHH